MPDELFDASPYERPEPPARDRYVTPDMGKDATRTARRRADIEDGIHPATRLPITSEGTCGNCAHLIFKDGPALGVGSGRWWKCTQTLRDGHGPDIRKSWPSCTAFENQERKA